MSGFTGIINTRLDPANSELLDRCQEEIGKCCDDFSGKWKSAKADLRFCWLKTTDDTDTEELPFSIDQNLLIVGDVRLDNRLELVIQLQKHFMGISSAMPDAYLLLYAYSHWGAGCLQQISGDYAFAIWNEKEASLFCARDHFGMIPFYYSVLDGAILFTNFYRSLKYVPGLMDSLDEKILGGYLSTGLNSSLNQTIYTKIKKLPAAHWLIYKNGKIKIEAYWKMPEYVAPIRYKTTGEYVARFFSLFERSVADRTRNSKVGCALSGGMDSSAVTATAANVLRQKYGSDHRLEAFNITYKYLVSENEGLFASLTAKHLQIPLNNYTAEDYLDKMAMPMDTWLPEPVGLPHASAEGQMLTDTAAFARVFLGGFGGDPLFEYDTDAWQKMIQNGAGLLPFKDTFSYWKAFRRFPPKNFFYHQKREQKILQANDSLPAWYSKDFFSTVGSLDSNDQNRAGLRSNFGMLNNPLWSNLFENSHPGFTGKKIKVRQPFFSLPLILFMRAMPPHLLFQKALLRMAMMPYLPKEIRFRPKTLLFGTPHYQNLKTSGVLTLLKKQLPGAAYFLQHKINIPLFLAEIEDINNLKENDHVKILLVFHVLAWKNFEI